MDLSPSGSDAAQPGAHRAPLTLRPPAAADGASLHALVRRVGTLDLNSAYAYMLLGRFFSRTSRVACLGDQVVGFVSAFEAPDEPNALFVWQVGVDPSARGLGVASSLLDAAFAASRPEVDTLLTTVSPSNLASDRLFRAFARRHGAEVALRPGFAASWFPGGAHEDEPFLVIGPLRPPVTDPERRG